VEAASLPLITTGPQVLAGAKARRAAKRAARLMSDADRFERAAGRLESALGVEAWQVRHLRRQAGDLRRLASEEAAALRPAAA
jgi:monoamine oxidase